jgi:hypothetical protein
MLKEYEKPWEHPWIVQKDMGCNKIPSIPSNVKGMSSLHSLVANIGDK